MAADRISTGALDGDLLRRARVGDRLAVEALCKRYRAPLVRFCFRYLRSRDAAEDVAQDVLTRIVVDERWPDSSFRAWMYRVARNCCINHGRSAREAPIEFGSRLGESKLASPRTGPGTAADQREREAALREALAAIPPSLAEVLTLRYFQDLTRREIAEVLDLSETGVKERLVQARQELARKLERESLE